MPICSVCNVHEATEHIEILGYKADLCGFDALKVKDFINGMIAHFVVNINWGSGRIIWSDWYELRDIIKEYNITEVLEFGAGCSSEMFIAYGLKVISFDMHETHCKVMKELVPLQQNFIIHNYENQTIPPVELLYPNRKWDFVFVDGPHWRINEVRTAMKVSNRFIFLHDPNLGEQDFFPNDEWRLTKYNKLYEKVK